MLHEQLKTHIRQAALKVFSVDVEDVHVEHPDNPIHGDFSTNVSFILAKQLKQSPYDVAKKLAYEISQDLGKDTQDSETTKIFEKVDALQPGFINFYLSSDWLNKLLENIINDGKNYGSTNLLDGKKVMLEYTDPNPFKVFH